MHSLAWRYVARLGGAGSNVLAVWAPERPLGSLTPVLRAIGPFFCLRINAPEGCRHGTHTNGTAYTRGTYSRVHTQTLW